MTTNSIFKGVATALITPTNESGVDYNSFGKLIDWQIEEGINALVVSGTTGEGSTLSDEEYRSVLEYAIGRIDGRVPAIAGTGSNNTAHAIANTKLACELGYDACLVVTPYYNKATQEGLVQMYTAIADASTKPLILYNVPSRTGVGIDVSTYVALADHPNIQAIKEANGNISAIVSTAAAVGDKLDLISGNDDQIVPILSVGGVGVISVLSNVVPKKTVEMCNKFFEGDVAGAAALQFELLPLCNALFSEVNPIPVKAAMAAMGFCENYVRLPLTVMSAEKEAKLLNVMKELGVL